MREPELTAERLRELIHYDAATGNFTRLVATSRIPRGAVAGRGTHTYYWRISVDGREYKAHRLAWLWMTGKWPLFFIDHINMDKADNRWCNLREATKAQNMVNTGRRANNSSSGFKNVYRDRHKYTARIRVGGKFLTIGSYRCDARAAIVTQIAAVMVHGEFARVDESIREALNAPYEPQPRVYIRPPHALARAHCHYIQLGAPSAMFMPQTSRVERGFGVSLAPIKQRVGFVWRKRVNTHDRVVPRNTSAIKY